MNLGEIIVRVQRQFGDESEAQITRADIIRWANDAQLDIIRKTEALQSHVETNSVKDDGSYTLPEDYIRLRRVTYDDKILSRTTLEEIDQINPTRDSGYPVGTPTHFYTWADRLWLYPPPGKNGQGNLDIYYLRRPKTLENDSDTPELPVHLHEDIVRYCFARAKELDEEDEKAQEVMADYEMRLLQSRNDIQGDQLDSYPSIRVLPGDDGVWY